MSEANAKGKDVSSADDLIGYLARRARDGDLEAAKQLATELERRARTTSVPTNPAAGTLVVAPVVPPARHGRGGASGKKKRRTTKGSNLYEDPRNGNWIWYRHDETRGGKRIVRSTKTTDFDEAIQHAAAFELDYQRRRAGLHVFDAWKQPISPLAERWIAALKCSDKQRETLRTQIMRAIKMLKLSTPADLQDPRIEEKLLACESEEFPRIRLLKGLQEPLKQFAKWLARAPHRYIVSPR